jgi:hypothetical protein
MSKIYWVLYNNSQRWHAVWAAKDTGRSVCGLIKRKGRSWDKISPKVKQPACRACKARMRDRARR